MRSVPISHSITGPLARSIGLGCTGAEREKALTNAGGLSGPPLGVHYRASASPRSRASQAAQNRWGRTRRRKPWREAHVTDFAESTGDSFPRDLSTRRSRDRQRSHTAATSLNNSQVREGTLGQVVPTAPVLNEQPVDRLLAFTPSGDDEQPTAQERQGAGHGTGVDLGCW